MNSREQKIFRKYLEKRGLKLTAERQALFDELFARHEHLEADELLVRLRTKHKKISRATIYRTLDLLVDAGIVGRVRIGEIRIPLRAPASGGAPRSPDLQRVRPCDRVLRARDREPPGRGLRALRIPAALPQPPDAGHLPPVPPARAREQAKAARAARGAAASRPAPLRTVPAAPGLIGHVENTQECPCGALLRLSLCLNLIFRRRGGSGRSVRSGGSRRWGRSSRVRSTGAGSRCGARGSEAAAGRSPASKSCSRRGSRAARSTA